ncbi:MAG: hypothetical protein ABIZ56_02190, partial [Chthoniobacteraceae bacterium]
NLLDAGTSMALQSDGRIVVATSTLIADGSDFALVRYTSAGVLDTSLAGTGIVITPISTGDDQAHSVALQNDGKIVVAGSSGVDYAVARYHADGALDLSFSGTGIVITNINGLDIGRSVAIQSDGKIVVAGSSDPSGTVTPARFSLVRYQTDGSLDLTFSGDGKVTTLIGNGAVGASVAVQCDGKILLAGTAQTETCGSDFALARYSPDGSLDTSFNGTGIVTTDLLGQFTEDEAFSVAVQPDGKIVAGGASNLDFALVRYTSSGAPDPSFVPSRTNLRTTGNGPRTQTSADAATSLALQSDGKIVLAGISGISPGSPDIALVRYLNDTPRQFFDNVAAAAGLSGPAAAPNATPFGDGIANLLKYAFEMNLARPDVHPLPPSGNSGLPSAQLVNIGGQTYWQFEFIRRKASGLIYTPLKSTSLALGSFVPMTGTRMVQNIGAECERVIVLEPATPDITPAFFGKIQVSLP